MKRIAVVLCVVFSITVAAAAQNALRTVTNADLAKYRDKRLAAEKEYRENYQKWGMPSPEELAEMRDRDVADQLRFASELRMARLERDRLALDERRLAADTELRYAEMHMRQEAREAEYIYPSVSYNRGFGGIYIGGFGRWGRRGGYFGSPYEPLIYRATPMGVFYEPGGRWSNIWSPVPRRIPRQ